MGKSTKDSTPTTAQQYAERAERHRERAAALREQIDQQQAAVQDAVREERDDAAQLRERLEASERELADTEAAASADEREHRRLQLLEQAAERRKALEQIDKLRERYDAIDIDAAIQAVAEAVGQQQAIESQVRDLMAADVRAERQWRSDWCALAAAARIMHGLSGVLDPGAFANTRPNPEQHGDQSWRQAARVIGDRAQELEQQAEIAERDDGDAV